MVHGAGLQKRGVSRQARNVRSRTLVHTSLDRARRKSKFLVQPSPCLRDAPRKTVAAGSNRAGRAGGVVKSYESFRTTPDVTLPEVESRCLFEAEWLKHNYVGTEHLILAVCSFSDCRAAKVLADIGTPSVEVCRDVLQLLGHQDSFDQWLADQPGTS